MLAASGSKEVLGGNLEADYRTHITASLISVSRAATSAEVRSSSASRLPSERKHSSEAHTHRPRRIGETKIAIEPEIHKPSDIRHHKKMNH